MLESLHVHNFALLEDTNIEFSNGFNVFTGETGAGKSILIDAFSVVLGGRASTDFVRSGTDGFWVQAVFDVTKDKRIENILNEQEIDFDDELFLKRTVSDAGKSKSFINGVQVPLQILREIGNLLVDIHGQHENQLLLKPEAARLFTDAFGTKEITPLLAEYRNCYKDYCDTLKKLHDLQDANNDREHLLEIYQNSVDEIENAELRVGEDEELETEASVLQHGEKIINAVNGAYQLLEREDGILAQLADAKKTLDDGIHYDDRLIPLRKGLDEAWVVLDDIRSEMGEYLSKCDFNEDRVTHVQTRLDLLYRLRKKYGGTLADVIEKGKELALKLEKLQSIGEAIDLAEKELATAESNLAVAADKLTKVRQKVASALAKQITIHIRDLAMPDGVVEIKISPLGKFTPDGADELAFLFSANKGEPLCELVRVASGGELSRVALAVKTVLLSTHDVDCMVFDEIDSGVGGVTAERMAEKMAILSQVGQIICITHLPQIAAFADRHIYIEKIAQGKRTITNLNVLMEAGRINELVRMAAGTNKSLAAIQTADEMLNKARKFKEDIKKGTVKKKSKNDKEIS